MDEYVSSQNLSLISIACNKMLKEKFNVSLPDDKLQALIKQFSNDIQTEYGNMDFQTKELNNITLSKIKKYFEKKQIRPVASLQALATLQPVTLPSVPQQSVTLPPVTPVTQVMTERNITPVTSVTSVMTERNVTQPVASQPPTQLPPTTQSGPIREEILDDDVLQAKLRMFETQRRMIEQQVPTPSINPVHPVAQSIPIQHIPENPPQQQVNVTIPPKHKYKTLIINSINRDWSKQPSRNGIRFSLQTDPYNYKHYVDCVCFPTFVKQITPYVLMSISDGHKNVLFSLTLSTISDRWDVWRPVDAVENINIDSKNWLIKFYDQTNSELNLGSDGIDVSQAAQASQQASQLNSYTLKLAGLEHFEDNFKPNDTVLIRGYNNKVYKKMIKSIQEDAITIVDLAKELSIDDFINSKILNVSNQYSIIIKYHYNK